eukprot:3641750-Heterocapsa_arctica.AAC.1
MHRFLSSPEAATREEAVPTLEPQQGLATAMIEPLVTTWMNSNSLSPTEDMAMEDTPTRLLEVQPTFEAQSATQPWPPPHQGHREEDIDRLEDEDVVQELQTLSPLLPPGSPSRQETNIASVIRTAEPNMMQDLRGIMTARLNLHPQFNMANRMDNPMCEIRESSWTRRVHPREPDPEVLRPRQQNNVLLQQLPNETTTNFGHLHGAHQATRPVTAHF